MYQSHPIVSEARSWIGTRFHHQGRVKAANGHKGGVDCLGLIIGVAGALGLQDKRGNALLTQYDETDYPWLPRGEALKMKMCDVLREVLPDAIQDGDIGLFSLDNNPQHVGVLAKVQNGFTLIHAYAPSRKVVEVTFDEFWQKSLNAVFRCGGA